MPRRIPAIAYAAALFVSAIVVPRPAHAWPDGTPEQAAISTALQARQGINPGTSVQAPALPAPTDPLTAFYTARGFAPVWADAQGQTRAAKLVLETLASAGDWGLDDMQTPANDVPLGTRGWSPNQVAAADLEISQLVMRYADQARGGRITDPQGTLSSYLDRRPTLADPATVLIAVATSTRPDQVLRAFHPQHAQFAKLQSAYAKLRASAKIPPDAIVSQTGGLLLPGARHQDISALRRRFKIAVSGDGGDDFYDAALVQAVKQFQAAARLKDDGIIGPATRMALTAGNEAKLATLRANLEQWRWMPANLGDQHLFVNIPEFTVSLVRNGATIMQERVITGKSDTQTPVFSKALSTIVLRPSWKLPDSIKLEKLLAAQRSGTSIEDQGYVIKKGKRTIDSGDVDWSKATLSDYEIFQPSGDGNALGDVKFLFPNRHSVYLHDTPSKALFNHDVRLFSHGCIRLRNPLTLAQILLDADKGDGVIDAQWQVRKGPGSNEITLDRPVPIHVAYFTAWADDESTVRIFDDPYGHEKRIRLALESKWKDIDKGDDHLAAVDTWELQSVRVVQRAEPQVLRPAARRVAGFRRYDAPMGVTKANAKPSFFKPYKSSTDRNSVGEIMRNALGGF